MGKEGERNLGVESRLGVRKWVERSMASTEGIQKVERAVEAGQLSAESGKNIKKTFVGAKEGSVERVSLEALVGSGEWGELNDRFYRTLAFGTGGLRGRTIGKVVTKAEMGKPAALGDRNFQRWGRTA